MLISYAQVFFNDHDNAARVAALKAAKCKPLSRARVWQLLGPDIDCQWRAILIPSLRVALLFVQAAFSRHLLRLVIRWPLRPP